MYSALWILASVYKGILFVAVYNLAMWLAFSFLYIFTTKLIHLHLKSVLLTCYSCDDIFTIHRNGSIRMLHILEDKSSGILYLMTYFVYMYINYFMKSPYLAAFIHAFYTRILWRPKQLYERLLCVLLSADSYLHKNNMFMVTQVLETE